MKYWRFLIISFVIQTGIALPVFAANITPDVTLTAGRYTETIPKETTLSWLSLNTERIYDPSYQSEIEKDTSCTIQEVYCALSFPRYRYGHTQVTLTQGISSDAIRQFLEGFDDKVSLPAQDAIFAGDANNQVYVKKAELPGQELDISTSLQKIEEMLVSDDFTHSPKITIELPVVTTEAKVKAKDQERLGLTELIGEGTSDFTGSPKNRIYNIKRALQDFDGVVVGPGEEFSFVEHLDPVDAEHGYLPELVIKDNKTQPEYGGGICQVSSTVFRAAIYSGLQITGRRNHSYAVRYYLPYGMDATIYVPNPDLKFVNNTGRAIFMQSEIIDGSKLVFRFFGTRDGRSVSIDGPHILEKNPDGSMKTIFTQIVKDANGNEMFRQSFPSNYKSPSLFPHAGEEEQVLTSKPKDWSAKQWQEYKRTR